MSRRDQNHQVIERVRQQLVQPTSRHAGIVPPAGLPSLGVPRVQHAIVYTGGSYEHDIELPAGLIGVMIAMLCAGGQGGGRGTDDFTTTDSEGHTTSWRGSGGRGGNGGNTLLVYLNASALAGRTLHVVLGAGGAGASTAGAPGVFGESTTIADASDAAVLSLAVGHGVGASVVAQVSGTAILRTHQNSLSYFALAGGHGHLGQGPAPFSQSPQGGPGGLPSLVQIVDSVSGFPVRYGGQGGFGGAAGSNGLAGAAGMALLMWA